MNFFKKKIKIFVYYTLIIFFVFFVLEIGSRILYSTLSMSMNSLMYGFNKKINLQINSIKKLSFSTVNNNIEENIDKKFLRNSKKNIKKDIINIWTFGGSTSDIACRENNDISWPQSIESYDKRIKVSNFAKSGTNTDFAINRLLSETNKTKIYPDIILWANFVNEQNVIFWGLERNKDKIDFKKNDFLKNKLIYNIQSIHKTLDQNSVFFFLFNGTMKIILENYFPDFAFKILRSDKKVTLQDYEIAIKNYNLNTKDAIEISKVMNSEFYIVTLPAKDNFANTYNSKFYSLFKDNIKFLEKTLNIKKINLKELIFNVENYNDFFCDNIHFTKKGNQFVGEKIYEQLLNQSSLF